MCLLSQLITSIPSPCNIPFIRIDVSPGVGAHRTVIHESPLMPVTASCICMACLNIQTVVNLSMWLKLPFLSEILFNSWDLSFCHQSSAIPGPLPHDCDSLRA